MMRINPITLAFLFAMVVMLVPENAHAFQSLQCSAGKPVIGTGLYDDSTTGACKFTGIQYIFSTIVCQFVTMINVVMGKLYCSVQYALAPTVMALLVVYVVVYGVQILMGTAQLAPGEAVTRVIKLGIVYWMVADPNYGVSQAVTYMFEFFIGFMAESARWVVQVMSGTSKIDVYVGYDYNPGITDVFKFLDDWIFKSLTGALSEANAKVMGMFVAISVVMPSFFFMLLYWWVSVLKMMLNTLMSFLMAVVAIAFLLGISPIFISFMLFRSTFQFFDQWLRFLVSFAMQVMVSFAILTLWLFSLTLFGDFFDELSQIVYPVQKVFRPAAAIYTPADTWGLCPFTVYTDPIPRIKCIKDDFNPKPPPYGEGQAGNKDYRALIVPAKVPEKQELIFYLFYHIVTLIIVSYGFASLQKNSQDIAKQLAGPSYAPILNKGGSGSLFGKVEEAHNASQEYMSKEMFRKFDRGNNNNGTSAYEAMINNLRRLPSDR